ncbi:PREDICTED: uncharacterized protein LOC104824728 [Tarenaya hassleriana]|uniref:uncharacterized protein LOC104824728 n=1 Tax=Tarenaya hassleriana TaxID=28532 RepID=UPI00053CA2A7|nr:PREDICTED: uncharacterized protein LOC104824728 [Tarenaya hassleriana]
MTFLVLSVALLVLSCSLALAQDAPAAQDPLKLILGSNDFGSWRDAISAESVAPGPSVGGEYGRLVLAADRTKRPDLLRGFRPYRGGWNITSNHYWASVGFTGAAGFVLAFLWLVSFGSLLAIHHCCKWRERDKSKGSFPSRRICLILLIVFTCAAAVGCILLSVGQDKFHGQALRTLKYVVNRSDYTVQTLKNVTAYLSLAKTINVTEVFLPSDLLGEIDKLNINLIAAAETIEAKTTKNAAKVKGVFQAVRSSLISVATVMLILSVLGLLLSILRHQHVVHAFVASGWILVAMTFILCGVFLIINNAISDTCVAMKEWVDHPHAETALSSILPCVDQKTTNQTLNQSKVVINGIVTVVNTFVYAYANTNPSPGQDHYYNQSGPPMPPLCNPFGTNMENRQCGPQEVSIANASLVWKNYTCKISHSGICTTMGRVTPDTYAQLVAAVNESYALEHYTPPLLSLQDCNFVRETFENITSDHCGSLERNLKIVNAGLGLISVGVLLCLVLWIVYANRPQREEVFADPQTHTKRDNGDEQDKQPGGEMKLFSRV